MKPLLMLVGIVLGAPIVVGAGYGVWVSTQANDRLSDVVESIEGSRNLAAPERIERCAEHMHYGNEDREFDPDTAPPGTSGADMRGPSRQEVERMCEAGEKTKSINDDGMFFRDVER